MWRFKHQTEGPTFGVLFSSCRFIGRGFGPWLLRLSRMLLALWGGLFMAGLGARAQADLRYARRDLGYEELRAFADEGDLRRTVGIFSSEPSRVPGYPGCTRAADYIQQQFREIGLQRIRREEYGIAIPVDEGATLRIMGKRRHRSGCMACGRTWCVPQCFPLRGSREG